MRQSGREVKVSNVLITSLALPQQLVWRHTPTTPGITCWAGIQQSADKVIDYNKNNSPLIRKVVSYSFNVYNLFHYLFIIIIIIIYLLCMLSTTLKSN